VQRIKVNMSNAQGNDNPACEHACSIPAAATQGTMRRVLASLPFNHSVFVQKTIGFCSTDTMYFGRCSLVMAYTKMSMAVNQVMYAAMIKKFACVAVLVTVKFRVVGL